MSRQRFSAIAHGDHVFMSPVSAATVAQLLGRVAARARGDVLDLGCGNAELLCRLVTCAGGRGVGYEQAAEVAQLARARVASHGLAERIALHVERASLEAIAPRRFAVVSAVGARPFADTVEGCLAALAGLVAPGGAVVYGEGYWQREPAPEYLAALGTSRDEMTDHAGNVAAGARAGLSLLWSHASTLEEWDAYEGRYAAAIERFTTEHPEDPDAPAFAARIRAWTALVREHGRDTLGFGLYLFAP